MSYDYKRELKELYQPPRTPGVVTVPPATYVAVDGRGDPNEPDGAYQRALGLLYGLSFTLKMAPKAGVDLPGYFAYVVPPLEGLWTLDGADAFDPARKDDFAWTSCIRLPGFVTPEIFEWARSEAERKKGGDFSAVRMMTLDEGLCVQRLHVGPYDDEPPAINELHLFAEEEGLAIDLTPQRRHHEIYLSDPRRTAPEKLKTVIRLPARPA